MQRFIMESADKDGMTGQVRSNVLRPFRSTMTDVIQVKRVQKNETLFSRQLETERLL